MESTTVEVLTDAESAVALCFPLKGRARAWSFVPSLSIPDMVYVYLVCVYEMQVLSGVRFKCKNKEERHRRAVFVYLDHPVEKEARRHRAVTFCIVQSHKAGLQRASIRSVRKYAAFLMNGGAETMQP